MPQAIAAAVSWVASGIGAFVGTTAINAGVTASTAAALANAAVAVSQIALYAGMQYGIDAVSRPEKQKPIGSELSLQVGAEVPRQMIIGERATGGSLVARYSYNGPERDTASLVIQLADHPCVALKKVYWEGRVVRDSPLSHGVRTEITSFSNSGGARVWMTWHDGRPGQAADSQLVTKSALDPEVAAGSYPAFTSASVGAGCAYVHIEVKYDSDILTAIPTFLFFVQGAKLYDRRKDTTAGGSGSHRLNDPATWEYSTNARVALDHYLLGYQVEDDDLAFGVGLLPDEVPYADFAAGADLCDEDVETGTTGALETIKRYAVNAVIGADEYFDPVLQAMQYQMAARLVDLGGRIGVLGAEERASVVTLTDADMVKGEPVQFSDRQTFASLVGAVQGSFVDPGNLWQSTPLAPIVGEFASLPDGGEATTEQIDLPYEIHPRRATRLLSAWLARESLQSRLAARFMPKAWALEPGDWFTLTSERLQVEAEQFEVVDVIKHDDFTVTVTARAIDPDFLAFDNDNDPDLSVAPTIAPVSLFLTSPSFTVAAYSLSGGVAVEPALRFTLTAIDALAREIVIEARRWTGSAFTGDSIFFVSHSEQTVTMMRQGILPGAFYKIRAKVRHGAKESPWTDWTAQISTTSTYSVGTAGVADGIVGQGDLATTNLSALPFGANGLVDSDFQSESLGWGSGFGAGDSGISVTYGRNYSGLSGARHVLHVYSNGTPTAGKYIGGPAQKLSSVADIQRCALPVSPTDRVFFRALLAFYRASHIVLRCRFYDRSGNVLAETDVTNATAVVPFVSATSGGPAATNGIPANFGEIYGFATAPTSAAYALLISYVVCNGSVNPFILMTEPMLCRVPAGQLAKIPYSPGPPDRAADLTSGATSAGISGQGSQATANHQRASSYTGTPTEGSWWSDTGTGTLKLYTGGAWQTVATLSGGLTATLSTSGVSGSRVGAGSVTTSSVTITPSGGSGYTYNWFVNNPRFTPTAPNSATTAFSIDILAGESIDATAICVVSADGGLEILRTATVGAQDTT